MKKSIKKALSILLAVVVIVTACFGVGGFDFKGSLAVKSEAASTNFLTIYQYKNYCYVDKCNKNATGDIVIPSTYNGLPVTEIRASAFSHCTGVESITIPDSVTSIGAGVFVDCTSLKAINVDENNKEFTSVDGVLYNKEITYLYDYPAGKTMDEYVIPDGVTGIGSYAMRQADVKSVILPDSLEYINEQSFSYSNIEKITIPDNPFLTISSCAFSYCDNLKVVVFSGSAYVYDEAFINSDNVVFICKSNSGAYDYCNNLINDNDYAAFRKGTEVDLQAGVIRTDVNGQSINKVFPDTYGVKVFMDTDYTCTGSVITLKQGSTLVYQFDLVVNGDTNGDSVCDTLDCFDVERALYGNLELSGAYAKAADNNGDDVIDITDYQAIVNKALVS